MARLLLGLAKLTVRGIAYGIIAFALLMITVMLVLSATDVLFVW